MFLKVHNAEDEDQDINDELIDIDSICRITKDEDGDCMILREGECDDISTVESFEAIERGLNKAGLVIYPDGEISQIKKK